MGDTHGIHKLIQDPNFPIKGGEFVMAIQIRCGTLKTPARAARGIGRGSPICPLDRQYADLNHILQVCQDLRVERHDGFCRRMRSTLVRKGFRCLKEPRIPVQNTFLKPDLVCWNGHRIIVLDPIICGDWVRLAEREAQKVALYNKSEVLSFSKNVANKRNERNGTESEIEVEVFGVALVTGARSGPQL